MKKLDFLTSDGERKIYKIVINRCYGGFGLSTKAKNLFAAKTGIDIDAREFDFYKQNSL